MSKETEEKLLSLLERFVEAVELIAESLVPEEFEEETKG